MRKKTVLKDGWRFLKHDMPVGTAMEYAARGEAVTVPHTWNAADGQDGGNDYHRGKCWYVRELSQEECAGEKLFLEINGAAMSAEVYLNGEKIAEHRGGYSAFRAELTGLYQLRNGDRIAVAKKGLFLQKGGKNDAENMLPGPSGPGSGSGPDGLRIGRGPSGGAL